MTARGNRSGFMLLDVLVALALLGLTASAISGVIAATLDATIQLRQHEERVARASRLLDVAMLWTELELDQRLGERNQGPFRLRIDRPQQHLYSLTVIDSLSREPVLRTARYVPDGASRVR